MVDLLRTYLRTLSTHLEGSIWAQYILDKDGLFIAQDLFDEQSSHIYEEMVTCAHLYVKNILSQSQDLGMDTAYHWSFSMPTCDILIRRLEQNFFWAMILKKEACVGRTRYLMQLKTSDLCQILS